MLTSEQKKTIADKLRAEATDLLNYFNALSKNVASQITNETQAVEKKWLSTYCSHGIENVSHYPSVKDGCHIVGVCKCGNAVCEYTCGLYDFHGSISIGGYWSIPIGIVRGTNGDAPVAYTDPSTVLGWIDGINTWYYDTRRDEKKKGMDKFSLLVDYFSCTEANTLIGVYEFLTSDSVRNMLLKQAEDVVNTFGKCWAYAYNDAVDIEKKNDSVLLSTFGIKDDGVRHIVPSVYKVKITKGNK